MQQTNATWSKVVVTNLEAIVAKNLSHNFQVMTSLTRQWQHLDGTWNPTDPARFIQPDAFPNNRDLSRHLFGNGDDNSLDGGGNESGVAYRPYSVRMAGTYFAPWAIRVVRELHHPGGRLPRTGDPAERERRSAVRSRHASASPTARRSRTRWPRRGALSTRHAVDGQFLNETARYLQLNLARTFKFGSQSVETGLGIFNVFNTGAHTQWNTGAQPDQHAPLPVALQPASAARVPVDARLQVLG